MAQIKELSGSIFDSRCQVIVNTVNCEGFMGKGIALEFRYRYPDMFANYKSSCERNEIETGKLTLWKSSQHWILNFPTKRNWKNPSKIEYVDAGLQTFCKLYKLEGIKSVAFPHLGTSHGGLNWAEVRDIMYRYLLPLPDLVIEIYDYDGSPDRLFGSVLASCKKITVTQLIQESGLNKNAARILHTAVMDGTVRNMRDIQLLDGFGEKSIERVYAWILSKKGEQTKLA